MGKKKSKEPQEIKLEEINVIMKIPKDAAAIDVTARVINDNGKMIKVTKTLKSEDIRKMRQDFLNNVEDGDDYDVRYMITEKGREWLKQLEKQRNDEIHSVCN